MKTAGYWYLKPTNTPSIIEFACVQVSSIISHITHCRIMSFIQSEVIKSYSSYLQLTRIHLKFRPVYLRLCQAPKLGQFNKTCFVWSLNCTWLKEKQRERVWILIKLLCVSLSPLLLVFGLFLKWNTLMIKSFDEYVVQYFLTFPNSL